MLLLDPYDPQQVLDQDTLHDAVAVLAQQAHDQRNQLFAQPPVPCTSPWTSYDFVIALQTAATGDTEALQAGLWRPEGARSLSNTHLTAVSHFKCWEELFEAVAAAGHIHVLRAVHAVKPHMLVRCTGMYIAACASGKAGLRILQWLESLPILRPVNNCEMLAAAASHGHLETLQWLLRGDSKGWSCTWRNPAECASLVATTDAWQQLSSCQPQDLRADPGSAALCALAAEMQDLPTLQKLTTAQPMCRFDQYTGIALAKHGLTDALMELFKLLPRTRAGNLLHSEIADTSAQAAAEAGQLGTLQWLWDHCVPLEIMQSSGPDDANISNQGQPTARASAELGFPLWSRPSYHPPDRAKWAMDIGKAAIHGGHLHVLEWLWENYAASFQQQDACQFAADKQHTSVLRWLLARSPPCRWEPGPFPGYHSYRKIWEVLSHHTRLPSPGLLSQIPMEADACREAAASNNLELMIWLRGHGCPWDARACNLAARHGHLGMLRWLRKQQLPCDWTPHTSLQAAQHDQPDTLLWLLQQGCPPPAQPELASDRCLAVLALQSCPLTPAALDAARALGLMSTPLVVGLARWQRKELMQPQGAGSQPGSSPSIERGGSQLLSALSRLPEDIVVHICGLAGMCLPIKHQ